MLIAKVQLHLSPSAHAFLIVGQIQIIVESSDLFHMVELFQFKSKPNLSRIWMYLLLAFLFSDIMIIHRDSLLAVFIYKPVDMMMEFPTKIMIWENTTAW